MLVNPHWINMAKYLGATFLAIYGAQHFYQAWKNEQRLDTDQKDVPSLYKVLLICLMLTWLNPHVYLDALVLIGSISTQYSNAQIQFALGAISASFVFFLDWAMQHVICNLFFSDHKPGKYWIYLLAV